MLRAIGQTISLIILIAGGTVGLVWYRSHTAMQRQLEEVQAKNDELKQIVTRLGAEKRVADVLVTEQKTVDGVLKTTLLFVETTRGGVNLTPRSFTINGKMGHIDAMVIKFDRHFVEEGDPLRGHSIALFTRIYGDHENPANAQMIDKPGEIPEIYRDVDPRISKFEQDLWNDFWKLFNDEEFRKLKNVRVANGQGVWGPFEPDKLYTITLESDGGLNISSGPVPSIYQEALKRSGT